MQTSAIYQPPSAICRKCGAVNNSILVPRGYNFGATSQPGLELTVYQDNPWFHCNDAVLKGCPAIMREKMCSAMVISSAKQSRLGFDPDKSFGPSSVRPQPPPANYAPAHVDQRLLISPAELKEWMPKVFCCTYNNLDLSLPDIPLKVPEQRKNPPPLKANRKKQ